MEVTPRAARRRDHGGAEGIDTVVSCLASRTGGVADSWKIDYQATSNVLQVAPLLPVFCFAKEYYVYYMYYVCVLYVSNYILFYFYIYFVLCICILFIIIRYLFFTSLVLFPKDAQMH